MADFHSEQMLLLDAVTTWLDRSGGVRVLRRLRASGDAKGFDEKAWQQISEMGLPGILIPETHGGSDMGCFAMGIALEQMGRSLFPSPLISSAVCCVSALLLGGQESQKQRWLPDLAAGRTIAALAVDEDERHAPDRINSIVTNGKLNGRKSFVADAMVADLFIVAARTKMPGDMPDETDLFVIPATSPGIDRRPIRMIDGHFTASLTFDAVALGESSRLNGGRQLLDAILDRGRALLAAEMLGSAFAAFETTVEYLKTRVQFGRPIGSFQALQHRAAEMLAELEVARSTVEAVLNAIDSSGENVPQLASLAKVMVGEAFYRISNEMIQMHGGIGMTDEHDAGLFLKRARTCEAAFGGRSFHRERYARLEGY